MKHRMLVKTTAIGASCALIGAGAGIASSTASSQSGSSAAAPAAGHARHAGRARAMRRAVHADLIVAVRGGGFQKATIDRGVVRSVTGDRLTLAEGTARATLREITLTIPANARVRDNRQASTLAALKPGERVAVWQGPKRTLVSAHTPRTG